MSFNDDINFEFKHASGVVACRGWYSTFALMNNSKTLRDLLIYRHPNPAKKTLGTDRLAAEFVHIRDPRVMKSVFDFLATVPEIEKEAKETAVRGARLCPHYNHWIMLKYDDITSAAKTGGDFWSIMNSYACMLELQLDADRDLRTVSAALRAQLLERLHMLYPSARELEFAWIAFAAPNKDAKLFKAITARTITCLSSYCSSTNAPPALIAFYDRATEDVATSDASPTSEAAKLLRVVQHYPQLVKAFAEIMLRRLLSMDARYVTEEEKQAAVAAVQPLVKAAANWREVFPGLEKICTALEAKVKTRGYTSYTFSNSMSC